jgi:hypothetical protein
VAQAELDVESGFDEHPPVSPGSPSSNPTYLTIPPTVDLVSTSAIRFREFCQLRMDHTDEFAFENHDEKYFNVIEVARDKFVEEAHEAVSTSKFNSHLYCPLLVKFKTEDASDYGGPRRELLSLLLNYYEMIMLDDGSNFEEVKDNNFRYAAGVYCGIGIVQCNVCLPFQLELIKRFPSEDQFIQGLSEFGIPEVKNMIQTSR